MTPLFPKYNYLSKEEENGKTKNTNSNIININIFHHIFSPIELFQLVHNSRNKAKYICNTSIIHRTISRKKIWVMLWNNIWILSRLINWKKYRNIIINARDNRTNWRVHRQKLLKRQ